MQHLTDSDDQEAATEKVGGILAANGPDIDGMVSVAYVGSSVAATLLKNIGDGRIKFVGIDDDQAVLDGIRDGYVVGTMSQNPYGQAYIGAWVLDKIRQGCTRQGGRPLVHRHRDLPHRPVQPGHLSGPARPDHPGPAVHVRGASTSTARGLADRSSS